MSAASTLVAALLLSVPARRVGLFMKNWEATTMTSTAPRERTDRLRLVAEVIGIDSRS